jgi:hypothetical protein
LWRKYEAFPFLFSFSYFRSVIFVQLFSFSYFPAKNIMSARPSDQTNHPDDDHKSGVGAKTSVNLPAGTKRRNDENKTAAKKNKQADLAKKRGVTDGDADLADAFKVFENTDYTGVRFKSVYGQADRQASQEQHRQNKKNNKNKGSDSSDEGRVLDEDSHKQLLLRLLAVMEPHPDTDVAKTTRTTLIRWAGRDAQKAQQLRAIINAADKVAFTRFVNDVMSANTTAAASGSEDSAQQQPTSDNNNNNNNNNTNTDTNTNNNTNNNTNTNTNQGGTVFPGGIGAQTNMTNNTNNNNSSNNANASQTQQPPKPNGYAAAAARGIDTSTPVNLTDEDNKYKSMLLPKLLPANVALAFKLPLGSSVPIALSNNTFRVAVLSASDVWAMRASDQYNGPNAMYNGEKGIIRAMFAASEKTLIQAEGNQLWYYFFKPLIEPDPKRLGHAKPKDRRRQLDKTLQSIQIAPRDDAANVNEVELAPTDSTVARLVGPPKAIREAIASLQAGDYPENQRTHKWQVPRGKMQSATSEDAANDSTRQIETVDIELTVAGCVKLSRHPGITFAILNNFLTDLDGVAARRCTIKFQHKATLPQIFKIANSLSSGEYKTQTMLRFGTLRVVFPEHILESQLVAVLSAIDLVDRVITDLPIRPAVKYWTPDMLSGSIPPPSPPAAAAESSQDAALGAGASAKPRPNEDIRIVQSAYLLVEGVWAQIARAYGATSWKPKSKDTFTEVIMVWPEGMGKLVNNKPTYAGGVEIARVGAPLATPTRQ